MERVLLARRFAATTATAIIDRCEPCVQWQRWDAHDGGTDAVLRVRDELHVHDRRRLRQACTSIAPGAYQVDVRTPVVFGTLPLPIGMASTDFTACKGVPMFQLVGPGVNVSTTMTAGCQSEVLFTETFQPNSTYVAQDMNQPALTQASFTTLASGTPIAPVVTYGGGKGVAESTQDIVGSQTSKGKLNATVSANGTATLTNNGKTVSILKAGLYKFSISVKDANGSFIILGPTSTAPMILAGPSSKGMHTRMIHLTRGRWTYYTTLEKVRYFRVT